jgi:hypothetical protein
MRKAQAGTIIKTVTCSVCTLRVKGTRTRQKFRLPFTRGVMSKWNPYTWNQLYIKLAKNAVISKVTLMLIKTVYYVNLPLLKM